MSEFEKAMSELWEAAKYTPSYKEGSDTMTENCNDCGTELLFDVDHWCRCVDCGKELPNNDYDGQCKRCNDAEWQMEMNASSEWNWRNDHGDFN